jgi:hypothetical protein
MFGRTNGRSEGFPPGGNLSPRGQLHPCAPRVEVIHKLASERVLAAKLAILVTQRRRRLCLRSKCRK